MTFVLKPFNINCIILAKEEILKVKNFGVFDIIGPIMVGPSYSHTAGAARLGKIAKTIVGTDINKVIVINPETRRKDNDSKVG